MIFRKYYWLPLKGDEALIFYTDPSSVNSVILQNRISAKTALQLRR